MLGALRVHNAKAPSMNIDLDDIETKHHFLDGEIYAKAVHIPAGVKLTQHVHPYDHASALVKGVCLVSTPASVVQYHAPAMIMIMAGVKHSVTALTDCKWYCIHIVDDTDPDTVDASILAANPAATPRD